MSIGNDIHCWFGREEKVDIKIAEGAKELRTKKQVASTLRQSIQSILLELILNDIHFIKLFYVYHAGIWLGQELITIKEPVIKCFWPCYLSSGGIKLLTLLLSFAGSGVWTNWWCAGNRILNQKILVFELN